MKFNPSDYRAPFVLTYVDDHECECEFKDLFAAVYMAERIVEDGGFAQVLDDDGAEVPLFAQWNLGA